MGLFDNIKFLNPFSKPFIKNKELEDKILKQLEDNSQGMSVTELDLHQMGMSSPNVGAGFADYSSNTIDFNQIFTNKRQKIAKYREMSYYPEIGEALTNICNEAIVEDSRGDILHLQFKKELPNRLQKKFQDEFKNVADNIFEATDNLHSLFKKWLVEGELYIEFILDNSKKNIIGYKILPAFTTFPVYAKTGQIKGFLQSVIDEKLGNEKMVPLESNQVSYTHWGEVGHNLLDIRGYLEPTIRTYNQLKSIEDSLIVYRLVRAPERRVWNIEVGRMPHNKAEEVIKKIIHKYKRNHTYNPSTGSVDSSRNVQSLAEDFWFSKKEGNGTSVETLASGMNLGELDDVKYFLSKMYKTLQLPKTRWSPDVQPSNYTTGRDLDREELKFSLFVNRMQKRFKKIIKDCFMEQLKFHYKDDPKISKYIKSQYFDVLFTQANFFKEIKDLELMETRLNILGTAISFVTSPDEPTAPLSRELVLRRYFQMSDEEYELNEKLKKKEMAENKENEDEFGNDEEEPPDEPEEKPEPNADKEPESGGEKEPEQEEETKSYGQENIHQTNQKFKDFLQRPKKKVKKVI